MSQYMTVCIQAICVRWHKGERGGPEAVRRNQVSEALKMPPFEPISQSPSYVKHEAVLAADNGFTAPVRNSVEVTACEPVKHGGVSLAFAGDVLNVYHQWDRSQGAPERSSYKHKAFCVSIGEWGRVRYNGRLSLDWDSYWSYEKWVYNIGLFQSPPLNVFLKTEPKHIYSQMGHLF